MCQITSETPVKRHSEGFSLFQEIFLQLLIWITSPFIFLFSYFHDHIMMKFLNTEYIYNVSWEDPRMDMRVLDIDESDHVLTIASAGDNVLDYLIEGAQVTGVDFNLCQIALIEIKAIAIQELEFEEFFAIFGSSDMDLLRKVYASKLRPFLSARSAEFWDREVKSIKTIMYSGTSGYLAYFLFRILFPLFGLGWIRQAIATNMDLEEFRAKIRASGGVKWLIWLGDNVLIQFGSLMAGVPIRQFNLGLHRHDNVGQIMDKVFLNSDLMHDNYFFAGYILGEYLPHNCPRYLRKEHYQALRNALAEQRLSLFHGSLTDAIKRSETPFTIASLLDHMDWMEDSMISEEITLLMENMDPEKYRIFWRSYSDDVHSAVLLWLNPVRVNDYDDRVCMYWSTWLASHHYKFNSSMARETPLTSPSSSSSLSTLSNGTYKHRVQEDQIHTQYPALLHPDTHTFISSPSLTYPYIDADKKNNYLMRNKLMIYSKENQNPSLIRQLITGLKLVIFPFKHALLAPFSSSEDKHKSTMELFYENQKEEYDSFRESLLVSRPNLMEIIPLFEPLYPTGIRELEEEDKDDDEEEEDYEDSDDARKVWIDIGGGTGRNLEFFTVDMIEKHFKKIVIVDISPSLLSQANKRIERMGLSHIIETLEHDINDEEIKTLLPKEADLVTMSYSCSMIPQNHKALTLSSELLKMGGFLGVCDFFVHGNYDHLMPPITSFFRRLESQFHKLWFKQDHIHLLSSATFEHLMTDDSTDYQMKKVWDERFRGKVPFLSWFLRPFHGVVLIQKQPHE
jgi:S-adenosylmethionine:diacylglycerol 3-amino-3-carboxypropyl transferase/ubiquinone/menaquinone biosynthesis C-methylase UbiE